MEWRRCWRRRKERKKGAHKREREMETRERGAEKIEKETVREHFLTFECCLVMFSVVYYIRQKIYSSVERVRHTRRE